MRHYPLTLSFSLSCIPSSTRSIHVFLLFLLFYLSGGPPNLSKDLPLHLTLTLFLKRVGDVGSFTLGVERHNLAIRTGTVR